MHLIIWNHPDAAGASLVPDAEMPRYKAEQDPRTCVVAERHIDLSEDDEVAIMALRTLVNAISPGYFWMTLENLCRTSFDLALQSTHPPPDSN